MLWYCWRPPALIGGNPHFSRQRANHNTSYGASTALPRAHRIHAHRTHTALPRRQPAPKGPSPRQRLCRHPGGPHPPDRGGGALRGATLPAGQQVGGSGGGGCRCRCCLSRPLHLAQSACWIPSWLEARTASCTSACCATTSWGRSRRSCWDSRAGAASARCHRCARALLGAWPESSAGVPDTSLLGRSGCRPPGGLECLPWLATFVLRIKPVPCVASLKNS